MPRAWQNWAGSASSGTGRARATSAATRAETDGIELIDIPERDADVPLSETGRDQAAAVAGWLAALPADQRPQVAVVSPYLRAVQTAQVALDGSDIPVVRDERLRDRELGILDLLTSHGVRTRLPQEAERRRRLGKFYYRPPGGESWADVALRLRSLLGDLRRDHEDQRVLLFGHEAIVHLLQYLIEGLTEEELMVITRSDVIANGSISTWRRGADGALSLVAFNSVEHLHREGAELTREEEVHAEPV